MNKRGIALIFTFLVIMVLSILLSSFFLSSINENSLVRRYVSSVRAFWLAETGIAEAVDNMPNNVNGSLGSTNWTYSANTSLLTSPFYQIESTGSVQLPSGEMINRSLTAVVMTNAVDPNNFQHAIRTTVDLVTHGNVTISCADPAKCPNGPTEEFASLSFSTLFEHGTAEIKSFADYVYSDPPNNVTPVAGITWVDVSEGQELRITSDTWSGNGILIVSGDAQITGGTFSGIIYVIGELRMSGNPTITGSILAESAAEIGDTTLTGTVTITHDFNVIQSALSPLQFISPEIVAWREN